MCACARFCAQPENKKRMSIGPKLGPDTHPRNKRNTKSNRVEQISKHGFKMAPRRLVFGVRRRLGSLLAARLARAGPDM